MTSIFVLASDLAANGPARQLALTLPALDHEQFRLQVGVLGECGANADELRNAGVPIARLPIHHGLDVGGVRRLRQAVSRFGADVIHAVGPAAVRASVLLSGPRFVVSDCSYPGNGLTGWLAVRQLRKANRVLYRTDAEAARYCQLGIAENRLACVELAVDSQNTPLDGSKFRESLGLPPHSRLILAAGRLDRDSGLKRAVWAFDGLKHESPDLFLLLIGEGPDRSRLETFGRALGFDDYRIHFAGFRADARSLFAHAEAVWVTHTRGGTNIALEAMAAGRPVLGWNTNDLASVVRNGESGFLVPKGDSVALASKTCMMLENADAIARLGETGRRIAREHTPHRAAAQLAAGYRAASG